MALEPLGDLLGGTLTAGQQRALAGGVPAAFAHRGAGQVDEQVGLDAGVEVGQCGQGLDPGAELVAGLVREAGDDDDAPVLLCEITGQMAADETAAAQKDDDGLLFHESFLAWTDGPLPSINVSILSPNMVDVQREARRAGRCRLARRAGCAIWPVSGPGLSAGSGLRVSAGVGSEEAAREEHGEQGNDHDDVGLDHDPLADAADVRFGGQRALFFPGL